MRHVIRAPRFTGQAEPVAMNERHPAAITNSSCSTLAMIVRPEGAPGTVEPATGEGATFTSEVTFTGEAASRRPA